MTCGGTVGHGTATTPTSIDVKVFDDTFHDLSIKVSEDLLTENFRYTVHISVIECKKEYVLLATTVFITGR